MFTQQLQKRLSTLPDAFTPKEAEAEYWKTPDVRFGRLLKLVGRNTEAAPPAMVIEGVDPKVVEAQLEAMKEGQKALADADEALTEYRQELLRLCDALGVDPEQPLSEIVNSLIARCSAADNGEGEKVDVKEPPAGTSFPAEAEIIAPPSSSDEAAPAAPATPDVAESPVHLSSVAEIEKAIGEGEKVSLSPDGVATIQPAAEPEPAEEPTASDRPAESKKSSKKKKQS